MKDRCRTYEEEFDSGLIEIERRVRVQDGVSSALVGTNRIQCGSRARNRLPIAPGVTSGRYSRWFGPVSKFGKDLRLVQRADYDVRYFAGFSGRC